MRCLYITVKGEVYKLWSSLLINVFLPLNYLLEPNISEQERNVKTK